MLPTIIRAGVTIAIDITIPKTFATLITLMGRCFWNRYAAAEDIANSIVVNKMPTVYPIRTGM
jgi:hypothetical protein